MTQLLPDDRAVLSPDKPVDFKWTLIDNATTYRLEVQDLQGNPIVSAILTTGVSNYRAPSWLRDRVRDTVMQWRVIAFDQTGKEIVETEWHSLRFKESAK